MKIWVDYKRVERKVALETAKDRLPRAFSDAKRERLEYVIKQLEDESVTNIPPQTATLKGEYPLNILNELFKDFDDDYTLTPDAAATIDYVLSEDAFSNKDREIIGLRYKEGETLDTISQELGITKEAVRTRINKALRKLKYIRRIRLIKMGIGCYIEQMKGALAARDKEIAKRDAEILELKATIAAMSPSPLPLTDEVKGIKIWELDLSTRSFNALARAGLETVEDICNYSEPFCKIRNLGIKSFEELKSVFETKGIPFAGVWKNEGEG